MSGPTFNVSAGSGGNIKGKVNLIGAASGGLGNEVKEPVAREAIKTDISKATFNMKGAEGNVKLESGMDVAGLVEGGVNNKLVTDASKGGSGTVRNPDDCYKMDAEPRGICYIFNNKKFATSPRVGTDKDKDDLEKIFKALKFEVTVVDDCKAKDMKLRLRDLAEELVQDQHDCLVVIFLTHGREGEVQGVDGEWLKIDTITPYFNVTKCPAMEHKPKLFFFQSCRGKVYEKGVPIQKDDGAGADEQKAVEFDGPGDMFVAPESDYFFGYATTPYTASARNPEDGAWYIQELVKELEKSADKDDLLSLMTKVKDAVSKRRAELPDGSYVVQTAETTSRLRKKVYFLPEQTS